MMPPNTPSGDQWLLAYGTFGKYLAHIYTKVVLARTL